MPPSRRRDTKAASTSDTKPHKYHKKPNPNEPGVQKVKAALRQTRRLLAKENLAADVRIQTERRLKSLEADLAKAEIRKKERSLAVRYHKIKFFDKQKVVRKLKQAKRALEEPELDKKERKKLQKALLAQRVDLNYILNYPKLEKYVALYPTSESSDPETDKLREERRELVRQAMASGEMSAEPEGGNDGDGSADEDVEDDGMEDVEEPKPSKLAKQDELRKVEKGKKKPKADVVEEPSASEGTKKKKSDKDAKGSRQKKASAPQQQLVNVKDDDFFDA